MELIQNKAEDQMLLERLKEDIMAGYIFQDLTHIGYFTLRPTGPRIEWWRCFFNHMTQWRQERHRHNKSPSESENSQVPGRNAPTANFLHLDINGVTTDKVKTSLCRRSSRS